MGRLRPEPGGRLPHRRRRRRLQPQHERLEDAAPEPARPPSDAVATWTGKEVIIVGGHPGDGRADPGGAAYDPATDRWRLLPPLYPRRPRCLVPFTVWTGSRVMVWWGWAHVEID